MTEQTPEPTPAYVDPSASVAADTTPAPTEVSTPDPSQAAAPPAEEPADAPQPEPAADPAPEETPAAPVAPTDPAIVGGSTDPTVDANGEALPDSTPAGVDPQETASLVLDEPGHDGAFIHGNTVIGTSPVDVLAGDVEQILTLAKAAGRKVKVVEEIKVELED